MRRLVAVHPRVERQSPLWTLWQRPGLLSGMYPDHASADSRSAWSAVRFRFDLDRA